MCFQIWNSCSPHQSVQWHDQEFVDSALSFLKKKACDISPFCFPPVIQLPPWGEGALHIKIPNSSPSEWSTPLEQCFPIALVRKIITSPNATTSYKILQETVSKTCCTWSCTITWAYLYAWKGLFVRTTSVACCWGLSSSGRSRVWVPRQADMLYAFFLHPPFLPPWGEGLFPTFPTTPVGRLGLYTNKAKEILSKVILRTKLLKTQVKYCEHFSHFTKVGEITPAWLDLKDRCWMDGRDI